MTTLATAWPLCTADDTTTNFSRLSANGSITVPLAPLPLEAFMEVTFYVAVESVSGAPTTWTLAIVPQFLIPHTTGDQYSTMALLAFDATQKVALPMEGEDWTTWTQAAGAPVRQKRTYQGFGWGMALIITLSNLTGGSSPSVNVTASYVAKG